MHSIYSFNVLLGMNLMIQVTVGLVEQLNAVLLFLLNFRCSEFNHWRKAFHLLWLSKEMQVETISAREIAASQLTHPELTHPSQQ